MLIAVRPKAQRLRVSFKGRGKQFRLETYCTVLVQMSSALARGKREEPKDGLRWQSVWTVIP